eukprot:jgi/Bigna1/61443/fgenesh1_kg.22_\
MARRLNAIGCQYLTEFFGFPWLVLCAPRSICSTLYAMQAVIMNSEFAATIPHTVKGRQSEGIELLLATKKQPCIISHTESMHINKRDRDRNFLNNIDVARTTRPPNT